MVQAELKKTHYTFEEYLEIEKTSEERHEYYYGEIYNMAGTTKRHNHIIGNLIFHLKNMILNKKCEIYFESVKTELVKHSYYVYPDLVISCSDEDNDPLTIKTPIVVFEVLSDSTEDYDRGAKLRAYMQIPTLKHYVLVAQKNSKVECYTRSENNWIFEIFTSLDEFLSLSSLDLKISLADIYQNITFDAELKIMNKDLTA